jgi:hypothetical protein
MAVLGFLLSYILLLHTHVVNIDNTGKYTNSMAPDHHTGLHLIRNTSDRYATTR